MYSNQNVRMSVCCNKVEFTHNKAIASIKVQTGFTVDFLPEGPNFPPGPIPSLTYLCTNTGKEYWYNEMSLLGMLK